MHRTRSYRRHHAQRMRVRFKQIVVACWGGRLHDADWVVWAVRKWFDTRKPCSCAGCGNQRRYAGPPIQERRQEWVE